jgi:predicted metal-binding membrane protein
MQMDHGPPRASLAAATGFTVQWGVMMTAMMLPSAVPMILLYRGIGRRAAGSGETVIPAWAFTLVYLIAWLATGVPVYAASIAMGNAAARSPAFAGSMPYVVAATLMAAGAYQLTPAKIACLRACERPVDFLMSRWRSGKAATLRLAVSHAAYCIGCCWALMVVLVAAGAMSLPWVLAIALVVFAEKVMPGGGRTARFAGWALIAAGVAVAAKPELAALLKPSG